MYVAYEIPCALAYSQHPEKYKKQPETRKQDGNWQKIQDSKGREIEFISKKSEKIRKGIQNKKLIDT